MGVADAASYALLRGGIASCLTGAAYAQACSIRWCRASASRLWLSTFATNRLFRHESPKKGFGGFSNFDFPDMNGTSLALIWAWFIACCALVGIVVALKNGWLADPALSNDETSRRFAKRHALGLWLGVLPGIGFFVSIWLGVRLEQGAGHLSFVLGVLCFFCLFLYVLVLYRCPRCGQHPSSSIPGTSGLLFFPKKCSRCKAPLVPNHRWGQD